MARRYEPARRSEPAAVVARTWPHDAQPAARARCAGHGPPLPLLPPPATRRPPPCSPCAHIGLAIAVCARTEGHSARQGVACNLARVCLRGNAFRTTSVPTPEYCTFIDCSAAKGMTIDTDGRAVCRFANTGTPVSKCPSDCVWAFATRVLKLQLLACL